MSQDNWWGNLKVEHDVTCCIPFSLIVNLKNSCLVFYCTSYISAEFITIVQASLSNGQSMVQQCNKSFSAHWDHFTFFPFFSCNFFFQQPLHNVRPFTPFLSCSTCPPPQPWGFTETLKCIIRMKPGARQPKAPMASLLHTTHPTIWLAASLQGKNRPEEEAADVEFPVLTFWEVMDTNSLVHVAEFSRNIFKKYIYIFPMGIPSRVRFSIFPDVQINFTALKGIIWNRF